MSPQILMCILYVVLEFVVLFLFYDIPPLDKQDIILAAEENSALSPPSGNVAIVDGKDGLEKSLYSINADGMSDLLDNANSSATNGLRHLNSGRVEDYQRDMCNNDSSEDSYEERNDDKIHKISLLDGTCESIINKTVKAKSHCSNNKNDHDAKRTHPIG